MFYTFIKNSLSKIIMSTIEILPSLNIPADTTATQETKPKRTRRVKTTPVNKEDVVINEAYTKPATVEYDDGYASHSGKKVVVYDVPTELPPKPTESTKRKRNTEDKSDDKTPEVVKKPRRPPTYAKNRECICEKDEHYIQIANNIIAYFRSIDAKNNALYTLQDLSNLVFQTQHLLHKLQSIETLNSIRECIRETTEGDDEDEDYVPQSDEAEEAQDDNLETNSLVEEEL